MDASIKNISVVLELVTRALGYMYVCSTHAISLSYNFKVSSVYVTLLNCISALKFSIRSQIGVEEEERSNQITSLQ